MKSQKHNQGELKELKVNIESELHDLIVRMSKNSGISLDDLVTISLKRFCSSHNDYLGKSPQYE